MNQETSSKQYRSTTQGTGKKWLITIIAMVVMAIGLFTVTTFGEDKDNSTSTTTSTGAVWTDAGLKIPKSEITAVAKFYPVEIDKVKMEVLAVKASDGTIRTALNTCQICYRSGRGYYKQEGNELVCQNCKSRFKIDQVEKIKGGCNPVPILKANKTEDDSFIIISKDFLAKNKVLFSNWKKQ